MNEYKNEAQLGCRHSFLPLVLQRHVLSSPAPFLISLAIMPRSVFNPEGPSTKLKYIVTHVFFPLQLPDEDDQNVRNDCSLVGAISAAARLYAAHVSDSNIPLWDSILRMLDNLRAIVQHQELDRSLAVSQLRTMVDGG